MATRAQKFADTQKMLEDNGVDINKYNKAKAEWASMQDALKAGWWTGTTTKQANTSWWTPAVTNTSWWNSGSWLTNKSDIYWDVNKTPTTTNSMDFSSYTWNKKLAESDAIFGENAKIKEKNESWFLTRRNDSIASELFNLWTVEDKDVEDYLMKFKDFQNASPEDQANTKRAISDRLSEKRKANWDTTITDTTTTVDANGNKITDTTTTETNPSKDGYYFDKGTGEYVKIYWYDDLSKDYRDLIDRMDEQERKYLSNMWAAGMQKQVKTYLDAMRSKDQAEAMQEKNQELYDINRAQSLIEAQQTLRHSQEQYDNLKQNWQYLGNMWMPWTSATKIQAIGDSLKEAQTTLWEIQKLTQLKLDAQEKQWEAQVLQYNQQIDNLMYNLNWQVGSEVQAALSKFTTAELEWQLDTIDGITAFRKELLDDLDANISWLTSASLDQMQYITKEYQDIADKMYEYQQNANTVNVEMSQVKGFYVDGNGNPIYNAKWEPIEVPQNPPLDPVFDKETGKLIVFGYDENWNIVANVQQLWESGDTANAQIVSLLNQWYTVSDILKVYPNLDPEKVEKLSKIISPDYNRNWLPTTWQWKFYTATTEERMMSWLDAWMGKYKTWDNWWSCGHFVNNYLQSIWGNRMFGDDLSQKIQQINTLTPKIWSIIVMDSPTAPENWHVWIVTDIDENGNMTVLQSNRSKKDPNKVFTTVENVDSDKIYWYFDPTMSIEDYNKASETSSDNVSDNWYNTSDIPNYTAYLTKWYKAFSDKDKEEIKAEYGSLANFKKAAEAYKQEIDNQVSDVAMTMLVNLDEIYNWLTDENGEVDTWKYTQLMSWIYGDGAKYKRMLNQVKSSTALQKLIDLKWQWATFGALSDQELWFITNAADWLALDVWPANFAAWVKDKMNTMLKHYWLNRNDIQKMKASWDYSLDNLNTGWDEESWWDYYWGVGSEWIYTGGRWAFS